MHLAEMHTLGVKVDFSRKDFLYWLVLSVFYQKIGNVLINLFIFCISTQRVSCPSKPKSFNCLSRVNFLFFIFYFLSLLHLIQRCHLSWSLCKMYPPMRLLMTRIQSSPCQAQRRTDCYNRMVMFIKLFLKWKLFPL